MNRQFRLSHTVRYDECNCDGFLMPVAFARYMQDIASRDAEDSQLVGEGYWIIKRTKMTFSEPIPLHTNLELKTFGIGFSRITALRGYEARLAEAILEEPLASAQTLWVYVNSSGRPIRLPERTAEIWMPDGVLSPPPDMPFPVFPEAKPDTTSTMVKFSEIDLMYHLNNASVVEILDNAAWEALINRDITPTNTRLIPRDYDIEYVDSPRFSEQLEIQNWFEPMPTPGQPFTRFQHMLRDGKTMVRACSRWLWETAE